MKKATRKGLKQVKGLNQVCVTRREATYCAQNCFPRTCTLGKILGMGSWGIVFEGHCGSRHVAIKIVPLGVHIPTYDCNLTDPSTFEDCQQTSETTFLTESNIAKKMGDNEVGPFVFDILVCNETTQTLPNGHTSEIQLGVLIMEFAGVSLETYQKKETQAFFKNFDKIVLLVKEKAKKMSDFHMAHTDIHFGNIVLLLDKYHNIKDLRIIDFGDIETLPTSTAAYNKTMMVFGNTLREYGLKLEKIA